MLFGATLWYAREWSLWFTVLALGIFGALACSAAALLFDRRPKIVMTHEAIEVVVCRSGPIRYREIVHVECFRTRDQESVALFITPEAQARLPVSRDGALPVFAHEMFTGPPLWFSDGALDCCAADIAAELEARRRGATGPLTRRQHGCESKAG
jgi:hypothetical protein